jgi:hypothetical protein
MRRRAKIEDVVLANDIEDISERIGRMPTQEDYNREGTFGLNTLLLRKPWNQWLMEIFGQINTRRKRKHAGVQDSDILEDVRRVEKILGKPPTQQEYGQYGHHPISMVLRRHRWNEWLLMAIGSVNHDVGESGNTRRIEDSKLIDDIQRVAKELFHSPTRGEYKKHGRFSPDTITSRKPWAEFLLEDCGLEAPRFVPTSKASDEELIAQLVGLKEKLGRIPLKSDLGGNNGFSCSAYERAFGTFGNALAKAGLIDPLNRYCIPHEELLAELKRVYALLGHIPSEIEFLKNSPMRNNSSIRREFGSWTKALLEAGIPVVKAKNVSKEDVITAIRKWHADNNGDDTCLEYWKIRRARDKDRREFPYSCVTISSKFNHMPWEEIMHECGFPNYETKDPYVAGHKRGNHTGLDGNEYLSSLEKQIGDFLLELKNQGRISGYEYEAKVCQGRAWTCDFKVSLPDGRAVWLEADGLRRNRRNPYFSGGNEKIKHYISSGMSYGIVSYSNSNVRSSVEGILFAPANGEIHP